MQVATSSFCVDARGDAGVLRSKEVSVWPGIAASLVVIKDFDASSSPVMDGMLTFASMKKIEVDVDREIYCIFFYGTIIGSS